MLKQKNIKILAIRLLILFFTIFTIINMFPNFAQAEITNTVENRAKSWTMYNTLIESGCNLADRINANTIDKMERGGSGLVSVGHHVTGSDEGRLECLRILNKSGILKIWGYEDGNYSKFLTDLGYKLNNGWYENSLKEDQITRDIIKIIPSAFGTQNNANPPKDIQWYIYYTNFSKGCKINQETLYDQASQDDKNAAQSKQDNLFIIYKPNASGGADKYLVKTDEGRGRDIQTGWGLPTNIGGAANCEELAMRLNDESLALAYATSMIAEGKNPENTDPNGDGGITTDPDENKSCGNLAGPFGWIICEVGELGDKIIDFFDKGLYMLLDVPTASWERNGVKTAWETFRNISSTLIVLVALVGIASQIFNFDFVSAYTIRKILPKLFIAIILIQLSWFLGTIMIQISNTIGYSIQSLIMAPFIAIAEQKLNTDITQFAFSDVMALFRLNATTPGVSVTASGGIMATAAIIAGASAVGSGSVAVLFAITSLLLTAGIALLVAFTVIAFRYALILALLVVMPIAIVAWVLPSTKKWFDRWWDMFFALLAMFPIIIAVLSFGKAAAIIIALSAGGN